MDKTAIKNFAIWARKKLIGDISYKASLLGITPDGIRSALPQSTREIEFYDIGLQEPYAISRKEIEQRRHLAELIRQKEQSSDYATAYNSVIEEVAYTWFNRLIAVRFMEVNDYLPSHTRILSSDSKNKLEPDIVTNPFDTELTFTEKEKEQIIQWQHENAMDSLFMLLFIKACNALNELLPKLFESTTDYTELLLNLSVSDRDGVVYHLVHDIPEEDFDVEQGGEVEIIGWLYQYYNAELKDETFALLKKNVKITKERIPSATQLFTPDWIVRYMVENSLGRLWVEGHPNAALKANWKYYLEEAEQEPEVEEQLKEIRKEYAGLNPEDIRCMDPCMGSGHILVYMFDVLMQIYGTCGYTMREAAASIVEHNLWGLDIDERAAQLAYFSVMMKARQYDRRFLTRGIVPHVYAIHETNALGGSYQYDMGDFLLSKEHQETLNYLLDAFVDAKEYGSILQLENRDYSGLERAWVYTAEHTTGNTGLSLWQHAVAPEIPHLINQAIAMSQKYHVVVTNPPYMGSGGMSGKLSSYLKAVYPSTKFDLSVVFMEKTLTMCGFNGFTSMINIPVWMFLSSYEKFRMHLLENNTIINLIHPGRGIFGSDFGTATYVFSRKRLKSYSGIYCRLFKQQGEVLSVNARRKAFISGVGRFTAKQEVFSDIPGKPIAYWVSDKVISIYKNSKLIKDFGVTRQGIATGENDRFMRFWYEPNYENVACPPECYYNMHSLKWYPYHKGGEYRKWYGNNDFIVNWENNGREIKNFYDDRGKLRSRPQNLDFAFRECITWSLTNISSFGARYRPKGFMFDINGMSLFIDDNLLVYALAFLCSNVANVLMRINNPTLASQAGDVARLPFIIDENYREKIGELTKKCVKAARKDWDSFEISWDFQNHPLVPIKWERDKKIATMIHGEGKYNCLKLIANCFARWEQECEQRFTQLKANEEELNRIFIDIYGLQDELTPDVADKDVTIRMADLQRDVRSLISYAVGCMFGRYSIDQPGLILAGQAFNEKFAYSSVIPSGIASGMAMLNQVRGVCHLIRGNDDLVKCSFLPDDDNVIPITDEDYFDDDIVGVFCKWLVAVYGADTLEENLDFIASALGNSGNTSREIIRNYFLKDFYKDHCKIYQKRPIYWLFDSGKQNGFKALIYLHRYDKDTIGNMRAEYLHRMEHVYESEINRMNALAEQSELQREAANARKRAEKLQKQLRECREYDEKVGHLAIDRIELDLDDGVKVNYEKLQTDRNGNKYQILAKI